MPFHPLEQWCNAYLYKDQSRYEFIPFCIGRVECTILVHKWAYTNATISLHHFNCLLMIFTYFIYLLWALIQSFVRLAVWPFVRLLTWTYIYILVWINERLKMNDINIWFELFNYICCLHPMQYRTKYIYIIHTNKPNQCEFDDIWNIYVSYDTQVLSLFEICNVTHIDYVNKILITVFNSDSKSIHIILFVLLDLI